MKTVQDQSHDKLMRKYISESISNSHGGIKSCWLIMFSAGTMAALTRINASLQCHHWLRTATVAQDCQYYNLPMAFYFMTFIIFFLTFARFYVGDVRIFDIRYTEIFRLVNDEIDSMPETASREKFQILLAHSDRSLFKYEIIYLLFQTLVVVFLAHQVDDVDNFVVVYICLMFANSAWLSLMNLGIDPVTYGIVKGVFGRRQPHDSFGAAFPRSAAWVWIKNNVVHGVALTALAIANAQFPRALGAVQESAYYGLCLALCASNCLADFWFARGFYFPKFATFYRNSLEGDEAPPPALRDCSPAGTLAA